MRLALVFLAIFILGCSGGEEPTVTPEPTRIPVEQVSKVVPSPTIIPTVIPTPTATPIIARAPAPTVVVAAVLPQATGTPIILSMNPSNIILEIPPTPTPTPTVVPTATATITPIPPTPTPTPVILVGTVDIHLMLPIAPNGVAGYIFEVVVGPHVALVDFKSVFSLVDRVGNQVRAADLAEIVEAGAVNVTLGTITFKAISLGAGPIQINIIQFDDDDGFPINALFDAGFIEVR